MSQLKRYFYRDELHTNIELKQLMGNLDASLFVEATS